MGFIRHWLFLVFVVACLFIICCYYIQKAFSGSAFRSAWMRNINTSKFEESHYSVRQIIDLKNRVKFLKGLKNPCWYEMELLHQNVSQKSMEISREFGKKKQKKTAKSYTKLRCLPYFFLAGMPKCATTDIFSRISLHPQVIPPKLKGPHWWTRMRFGKQNQSTFTSMSEYLDMFDAAARSVQHYWARTSESQYLKKSHQLVTGDGSTSTFWDSHSTIEELREIFRNCANRDLWQTFCSARLQLAAFEEHGANGGLPEEGFNENSSSKVPSDKLQNLEVDKCLQGKTFTVADVIHSVLPNSRVVVALRDPVARLYSSYLFFTQKDVVSPEDFDSKVRNSVTAWKHCTKHNSLQDCAYNKTLHQILGVRLYNGLYSIFLKDWLAVYPLDQLLVIRTEDYQIRMKKTLDKIFSHLKIRKLSYSEANYIIRAPPRNKSRKKKEVRKMLLSTEAYLKNFYKPFNGDLAELLKDPRFNWEDIEY